MTATEARSLKPGHNRNGEVLTVGNFSITVQFEDRADTTTISYADLEWLEHMRKV